MNDIQAQEFFLDPSLGDLIEIRRNSDNPFNATSQYENQHSDIISWLFNSQESHGQGDLILKDFLRSIYSRATNGLSGNGGNKSFVNKWTPGVISVTNFSSAIPIREYVLDDDSKSRIDILLIDPVNKFVIGIENKSGTKHSNGQLDKYYKSIQKIKNRPVFSGYLTAYIALDKEHSIAREEDNTTGVHPEHERWMLMDYSWLKHAARRAESIGDLDKHSAAFIKSYGQQQGVYSSSESEAKENNILAQIALRHAQVIKELRILRSDKSIFRPAAWGQDMISSESIRGQLMRFYMQNESICDQLTEVTNLHIFDIKINKHFNLTVSNIDKHKSFFAYRTKKADLLPLDNGYWPIFISVKQNNDKYSVRIFASASVYENHPETIKKIFPTGPANSNRRTPRNELSLEEAIEKFTEFEKKIRSAIDNP